MYGELYVWSIWIDSLSKYSCYVLSVCHVDVRAPAAYPLLDPEPVFAIPTTRSHMGDEDRHFRRRWKSPA